MPLCGLRASQVARVNPLQAGPGWTELAPTRHRRPLFFLLSRPALSSPKFPPVSLVKPPGRMICVQHHVTVYPLHHAPRRQSSLCCFTSRSLSSLSLSSSLTTTRPFRSLYSLPVRSFVRFLDINRSLSLTDHTLFTALAFSVPIYNFARLVSFSQIVSW